MKTFKKLSLNKTTVAKLEKDQLKGIIGGITQTCSGGCPTAASTISLCGIAPYCTKNTCC